jgi:hypothetical protein
LDQFDPSLLDSFAQELNSLAHESAADSSESNNSKKSLASLAKGVSRIGDIVVTPIYRQTTPTPSQNLPVGASSSIWTPPVADYCELPTKRRKVDTTSPAAAGSLLMGPSTSAAAIGKFHLLLFVIKINFVP